MGLRDFVNNYDIVSSAIGYALGSKGSKVIEALATPLINSLGIDQWGLPESLRDILNVTAQFALMLILAFVIVSQLKPFLEKNKA